MHPEVERVIARLEEQERLKGLDPFGFRPSLLPAALPTLRALDRHWFRVEATGIEHVPDGRVLLVANHSGQLPLDGMMLGSALLFDRDPPRIARGMVEKWVPTLPFISVLFSSLGQVVGTPENARTLLRLGEALMVFPEGVRGISKTFDKRYQLQKFGHGFMRLALETQTPIVPVSIVGAEEQIISVYDARRLARLLGVPAAPLIVSGPLPLPVKYRIEFGAPIRPVGDHEDDDRVIGARVAEVREAIEAGIARGLDRRRGWFW
jgi:1-acyl-sn-glycerol-3-phosphate acyltransferase